MKEATKLSSIYVDASAAPESRESLLAKVDAIGPLLAEEAASAEADSRLTARMLQALCASGLVGLKVPRELGGEEADNAVQFEVVERMAYYSMAAAWCYFIYIDVLGRITSLFPDATVASLVGAGEWPLACGGGGLIAGELVPADGGYKLSGRWIYGSGNSGSDYFLVLATDKSDPDRPQTLFCLVESKDMDVANNWDVVGMRGTGSSDFSCTDVFVPSARTCPPGIEPRRGGAIFRLGSMGYAAHTLASIALGGTRRALDEIAQMASTKARGYAKKTPLSHRQVFQAFLGRSRVTVAAMYTMMVDVGRRIVTEAEKLGANPLKTEIESRTAASLAVLTAVEIMSGVLRYSGGEGSQSGHLIERTVRDLQMAQTHFFIHDSTFELYGRALMGEEDLDAAS